MKINKIAIALIILTLTGCVHLKVESDPPGAKVTINNRNFGTTPTNAIKISRSYPIIIKKNGYETYEGTISSANTNPYKVTLVEKEKEKTGLISITIVSEGGKIITTKEKVHAETNTIERSPNVKSVRKITNLSEYAWLGNFQISPDGRNVIFEQYEEESIDGKTSSYANLWSTSTSHGPVRRVTQGKYFDRSPAFSPEGKDIYFSSNRLASFDIWKLSYVSGAGLALKTNSSMMQENYPSKSPDDSTLLFSSFVRGSKIKQIWTLGSKNGELLQLREGQWPRWFPNGQKIIFSSIQRTTGEWKIWTMSKDGASPIQISTTNGSSDIHASVSPNGKKIVFASNRAKSENQKNYDIWFCDIDGSNLIQLTTNGSKDDYPIFSPDGKIIFFRSNRGVKWDIWAMKLAI